MATGPRTKSGKRTVKLGLCVQCDAYPFVGYVARIEPKQAQTDNRGVFVPAPAAYVAFMNGIADWISCSELDA